MIGYSDLSFWILTGLLFFMCRYAGLRAQNSFLLIASLLFYGEGHWARVLILLASASVDFIAAPMTTVESGNSLRKRRIILAVSLTANLGLLAYFKYIGFFLNEVIPLLGIGTTEYKSYIPPTFPLGISFYTFQAMSYTIDCYRGKAKPCRFYFDYLLYISFFPQLVAGPIEKAASFLPQFLKVRRIESEQVRSAVMLIGLGLFKKFYIGDGLADPVDFIFGDPHAVGPEMYLASWLMAIRVYFDFSAYSDIGRGLARLFGIELSINFKSIWDASNPTLFWERWNITTGRWFRDYVLIPIGGNGNSRFQMARNMIFMFILIGFWHGASWAWLAWGAFHGVVVAIYRDLKKFNPWIVKMTPVFVGILFIQLLVLPAGGFLHAASVSGGLARAWDVLTRDWSTWYGAFRVVIYTAPLILSGIFLDLFWPKIETHFDREHVGWVYRTVVLTILVGFALLFARDPSNPTFIYFAF